MNKKLFWTGLVGEPGIHLLHVGHNEFTGRLVVHIGGSRRATQQTQLTDLSKKETSICTCPVFWESCSLRNLWHQRHIQSEECNDFIRNTLSLVCIPSHTKDVCPFTHNQVLWWGRFSVRMLSFLHHFLGRRTAVTNTRESFLLSCALTHLFAVVPTTLLCHERNRSALHSRTVALFGVPHPPKNSSLLPPLLCIPHSDLLPIPLVASFLSRKKWETAPVRGLPFLPSTCISTSHLLGWPWIF